MDEDERAPLLSRAPPEQQQEVAERARRNVVLFMFTLQFGLGGFLALRERYTEVILKVSDPVATATWGLVSYYGTHAVAMPVLGKLSDFAGRKALAVFGIGVQAAVFGAIAATDRSYVYLTAFALLGLLDASYTMMQLALVDTSNMPLTGALFGNFARLTMYSEHGDDDDQGSSSSSATSAPKVGDVADEPIEERRIGVLFSVAWMTGLFGSLAGVGTATGIANAVGLRAAVGALAGCFVLLLLKMSLSMPETAPDVSEAVRASGVSGVVTAVASEQLAGAKLLLGTGRRRRLLAATFLEHVIASGALSLIVYWLVFKFGFGIYMQGGTYLGSLVLVACSVVGLQGFLIELLEVSERACAALVAATLPFWLVLGLATEYWMALVGVPAVASIAVFPELRALLTADVSKQDQGFIQGALTSLNAVADILGSLACLAVFEETIDDDISHDSHRARGSLRANAIWHGIFVLQLFVIFILLNVPASNLEPSDRSWPPQVAVKLHDGKKQRPLPRQ